MDFKRRPSFLRRRNPESRQEDSDSSTMPALHLGHENGMRFEDESERSTPVCLAAILRVGSPDEQSGPSPSFTKQLFFIVQRHARP